jgi:hypothetical protein
LAKPLKVVPSVDKSTRNSVPEFVAIAMRF